MRNKLRVGRLLTSLERRGLSVGALTQERRLQVASVRSSADGLLGLPGPLLLKGGLECHPLTFRRDCLRHNEHRAARAVPLTFAHLRRSVGLDDARPPLQPAALAPHSP